MPPLPKPTPTTLPASAVFAAGNTALITGGASGIGLAIAQTCRHAGMKVGIVDRNTALLDLAKSSLAHGAPEQVSIFEADVSSADDWSALVKDAASGLGRVDLLVLNAGVGGKGSWGDGGYFETVLRTNLFGVVYGLNAFVPVMRAQQGRSAIVITGSKQGVTNPPGNPAYNASKAAVKSIAEHLSYDLRDTKTSVHLLLPGWTFTGMVSIPKLWLWISEDGEVRGENVAVC
jgi:NAD(P)-dependent dehydrogenase (short-subunit alcohol dehydrogenase family)